MAYNSAYTGPQIDGAVDTVNQNADYWSGKQNPVIGDQGNVSGFAEDGTLIPVTLAAQDVSFSPLEASGPTNTQDAVEDVYRALNSLPGANIEATAFQTFYNGGDA